MGVDRRFETLPQTVARLERELADMRSLFYGVSGRPRIVEMAGNMSTSLTFTNTGFLDLDAVTGGTAGTAIIVTVNMAKAGLAMVTVSARMTNNTVGGIPVLGWKVSGATTILASDSSALSYNVPIANSANQRSWVDYADLNAGVNTFELQARTSGGTADIRRTVLGVVVPG